MDIYDMAKHFKLSAKKLRWMAREGVLKVGESEIPLHWRRVRWDMRKGKMSALSIALAHTYPNMLNRFDDLRSCDLRVLAEQKKLARLPDEGLRLERQALNVVGAGTNDPKYLSLLVEALKAIIPEHPVGYPYVAVRLLCSCNNEYDMEGAAGYMQRALLNARSHQSMQGWWRSEAGVNGKNLTIYQRPQDWSDL